jgi:hypothetical protein
MTRHLAPSVLFTYQDARSLARIGYIEKTADHGGSDVTYFMREWVSGEPGALSVLSGPSFVRTAKCLNTRALSAEAERDTLRR